MSAPRAARASPAQGVLLIAAREFAAGLDSGVAVVVAIGFALLANATFMNEFFLTGTLDMAPYFERAPYLFLLFLPAISMRAWSEERRTRTFEVLLGLPFTAGQLVLGKFLAQLALLALLLFSALPVVFMLTRLGAPDLGLIAGGFAAACAAGALLLAVGSVASALVRDQVTAFVLAVVAGAALVLSGHVRVVAVLDGLAPPARPGTFLADHVSLLPHYLRMARGLVDAAGVTYFVAATALALWVNARLVERVRE